MTRRTPTPRRFRSASAMTVATCMIVATVVGVPGGTPATATSGGDPYSVPTVVDTNPAPNVVETTIVADEATVDIGNGVLAQAMTFNGAIPGPEIRLKVGDTAIVHFKNQITEATGIHWHGIELANASDGTPLTQNQTPPGGSFLYKFTVSRPGVFWYHPHHHSSTNQVFRGLYGSLIVTDPNEATLVGNGVLPSAARTKSVVLSDVTVCKAPGTNDTDTFEDSLPWVGGGPLPEQAGPFPSELCDTPMDDHGAPIGAPLAAGAVPNIQRSGTAGRSNEGQTVLTNGKNVGGRAGSPGAPGALAAGASTLNVQPGQGLRLQIVNTAVIRYMRLRLTTSTGAVIPLVRVGGEGGLLDNAIVEGGVAPGGFVSQYDNGETLLAPGDRADVVAAIPAAATGVATLWTEDFSRTGLGFANIPTVPVMHLNVTGAAGSYSIAAGTPLRASTGDTVEALGAPTGTLLDPATFAPPKPGLASQDIVLSATGSSLGINGVLGTHDVPGDYTAAPKSGSARYAKLGDTLELTVSNATDAHHPFHLHGFSIQPIELTKPASPTFTFPYREFMDEINVPARHSLRFRVRLDDRALMDGVTPGGGLGRWVMHCHIFFHAVNGMISELVVVAPNGNEAPTVNANAATVEVDEGQVASMTGTYADADGDPVTLTGPSVGTIVNNNNGTWSWSYTTADGPTESQFLHVTATDAGGRKNQVTFKLIVNNVAPVVTITSPPNGSVYSVGTNVTVTASISDPGTGDTFQCGFDFDEPPFAVVNAVGTTCSASHLFVVGGPHTVEVTALDDDGGTSATKSILITIVIPKVSIDDITITEGDVGLTTGTFTLSLSDPAGGSGASVDYTTANGTATAGPDYAAKTATASFAPGSTSSTATVDVVGDIVDELDETFFVNLSKPVYSEIVDPQGVGTIKDDDRDGWFTCRASALRISGGEPTVANAPNDPCVDQAKSTLTANLSAPLVQVETQALTASTDQTPNDLTSTPPTVGDHGLANSRVDRVRLRVGLLTLITADVVRSEARAECRVGPGGGLVPVLTGSSTLTNLRINGLVIQVNGSLSINVGGLFVLGVNQTSKTATTVTQRALNLTLLGAPVVVLGEARAGIVGTPVHPMGSPCTE